MSQSIRFAILFALSPFVIAQAAAAEEAAVADAPPSQPGLPHVTVVGTKDTDDYRVESVDSIGPLGSLKILDAPYTIGVLSEELIKKDIAEGLGIERLFFLNNLKIYEMVSSKRGQTIVSLQTWWVATHGECDFYLPQCANVTK